MELKRNAQSKYQLERQVEKLHTEKAKLQALVRDAKDALKRAVGYVLAVTFDVLTISCNRHCSEKASIVQYFATVEQTFQTGSEKIATEKVSVWCILICLQLIYELYIFSCLFKLKN